MAQTINPAVSRTKKRWLAHVASFVVGAFIGSALSLLALAVGLKTVALVLGRPSVATVVAAAVAYAVLKDLGLVRGRFLPYLNRQVPDWLRDIVPLGVTGFAYGFHLGLGFLTRYTAALHLAVMAFAALLLGFGWALAAMAFFALGKTLVIVSARHSSSLEEADAHFQWSPSFRWTLAVVSVVAALYIGGLGTALTWKGG